ncbi:MAG: CdaR family transcriptional regulator, partial [Hungatella sp.]|nr:CdaR family transcriptional regulator [Hungatella sp.]
MIETELAKKFIEQVTQYTEYNINIMNEQGVIIASRDPKRVGSFHEVAYYIVTGNEDIVVTSTEEDYPGVKPGINMVIIIDGRREGVVGI